MWRGGACRWLTQGASGGGEPQQCCELVVAGVEFAMLLGESEAGSATHEIFDASHHFVRTNLDDFGSHIARVGPCQLT